MFIWNWPNGSSDSYVVFCFLLFLFVFFLGGGGGLKGEGVILEITKVFSGCLYYLFSWRVWMNFSKDTTIGWNWQSGSEECFRTETFDKDISTFNVTKGFNVVIKSSQ